MSLSHGKLCLRYSSVLIKKWGGDAPTSSSCWRTWVETSWREAPSPRQGEFQSRGCCCAVIQQRGTWNEHIINYWKLILEWFPPKEFYKLPVNVKKISWRFPYFCKLLQKKNREIFVGHPVLSPILSPIKSYSGLDSISSCQEQDLLISSYTLHKSI